MDLVKKGMKIVHIMLCGPVTDGWSYQDNLLTKYHRKIGHDVTMIASQWVWGEKGSLVKFEKTEYQNENDVKVIRLSIRGKDNFLRKFKRYNGLQTVLEQEAADILFIHGIAFCDATVVAHYLQTHPVEKVYVDNHSDFSNSGTNWISKNILHKLIWKHYAQILKPYTTKFYGVLPARVEWLTNMYKLPKDKCELLVMGADDDKVKEAKNPEVRKSIREKYGISDNDFVIMTGGKIDSWKTQTLLLMEAVAGINNPKVKLIVFGSVTPDLKEQMAAHCVENKVLYIGWVQASESYRYFAAADLVVFPGRHSVFWEQVAGMGIPMICKYWEGTTHVDLGGNVVFLQKDSVEEIKYRIEDIVFHADKYDWMKYIGVTRGMREFSYKCIAQKSIE